MNIRKVFMRGIYFATSRTCNLNCSYCYLEEKKNKYNDADVVNGFKEFVDKLINNDNPHLPYIAFIGAEATILPPECYVEMIEYYKSKYTDSYTQFAIQTNGIEMKKHLDLLDPDITRIGTSLDISKNTNDFYRGVGSYDKVVENIKYAKSKGFDVTVQSVIQPEYIKNIKLIEEFIEFSKELNFALILKPVASKDISLNTNEAYEFGKWLVISGNYVYYQLFFSKNMCTTLGNNCYYYQFDPLGGVYTCNVAFGPSGNFANWKKEDFLEIHDKRINIYTDKYVSQECSSCEAKFLCNGGCPLDRHNGIATDCYIRKGIVRAINENNINIDNMFIESTKNRLSRYTKYKGMG